jgi:hypothetical protein
MVLRWRGAGARGGVVKCTHQRRRKGAVPYEWCDLVRRLRKKGGRSLCQVSMRVGGEAIALGRKQVKASVLGHEGMKPRWTTMMRKEAY